MSSGSAAAGAVSAAGGSSGADWLAEAGRAAAAASREQTAETAAVIGERLGAVALRGSAPECSTPAAELLGSMELPK